MQSLINEATDSKANHSERAVLFVVLGLGLFAAAAYCGLLFALRDRDADRETGLNASQGRLVIPTTTPRQLIDFSLTDRTGRTITRSSLEGKFLVVSFLFTSCSLTCPVVSHEMKKIQQLTASQPDVRLVSLTVDPEDDTPPVLAKYGERFDADTNRWLFLTGNEAAMHNLIGTSFLSRDTNDVFSYMPGNFANIERIALVDPQGNVRAYFDGLDDAVAAAVVSKIGELRKSNL